MRLLRALLCWLRHVPEWRAAQIYNHEGERSHLEVHCAKCGRKWWLEPMAETKKQRAMRLALEKIATMPLSKDFELDERGSIKSGSNAYGPGWAAYHFQELAKRAIQ